MESIAGAQIRAARAFLNWTIDELGHRSGVSAPTIRAIEHEPGVSTVKKAPERTFAHRQQMRDESISAIVKAIQKAGVVFLQDGELVGLKGKAKR